MIGSHEAGDWYDESLSLPKMDIYSRDRLPGPIGFIDFERLRAKAENGRNVEQRRCQIRTVKFKLAGDHYFEG
jgi:hypothetical protein